MNRLDDLLERLSQAVRIIPGAVELYLFGSAGDPACKDGYSDLDLQVLSADYASSRACWPWALGQAGPLSLAYPIAEKKRESVFWLMFAGESPYHKVDIGLSEAGQESGFLQNVPRKTLLWRQYPPGPAGDVLIRPAFSPEIGTPVHFLIGELLGSVRYVKARRRGQHLTCWRFLSARLNALLRCYQWDGRSPRFPEPSLHTWDFAALDHRLPETLRLDWLSLIDCRTPLAMDESLLSLTHRLVERIYPAWAAEETPAAGLIREMIKFIKQELLI